MPLTNRPALTDEDAAIIVNDLSDVSFSAYLIESKDQREYAVMRERVACHRACPPSTWVAHNTTD